MDGYQVSAIVIMIIFYAAYFTKVLLQKRKGIQTSQLGKGKKAKTTLRVEMILGIATMVIVPIEIISIYLDTKLWTYAPLRLAGLIIAASGTVIFIIAIWAMKESWRAGIPTEDKTEMITQGIYSFSRNPAFLGFDLVYIGILIGFGNVILIVITIFTVIMMHLQILQEEQFLEKVLGKQYRDYKNKVGRYFIFI